MVKVSIIVPVYNASDNISRCIDSILKQDYKDYELLLINDGSSDNSLEVINKYSKYKNIKILNQDNHGVSYTRNRGIKESCGKYIMFIDNDDFIDKDYVSRHVKTINQYKADVVISGYRRVNVDYKVLYEEKLKDTYWARYIVTAPWAKIYNREFLIKNNIEFFDYGIGEDVYFNLCMYSYNPKVIILDYVGYNWFFNTKSVSNTSQRGLNKDIDILVLLNKIIERYDNVDEYLAYYLTRYYIWYLLFSGREASRDSFILEYNRIKKWYREKNIKLSISPWSKKISGETFKNRLFVFTFLVFEKFHLVKLFARIYCKGGK